MKTLAIDTATPACSIALFDGDDCAAWDWQELGRGHAEHLVPMIEALPERGRADRILVSRGPGSFTGVRIGLAAARALGLVWGIPVQGYNTLALIAAMAAEKQPGEPVSVCMAGGHGAWFVQNFAADGSAQDEPQSLSAQDLQALSAMRHAVAAGSEAASAQEQRRSGIALQMLPDTRAAMKLLPAHISTDLTPLYVRAPDAALPAAR